jgi:hypothetical protein
MTMSANIPSGAKMNKLFMKLIIAAARGDKEKVYAISQELVKMFEEGLEENEDAGKG